MLQITKAGVYYATYGHWTLSLLQAGYEVAWQIQPDIKNTSRWDRYATLLLQRNFPRIPYGVKGPVDIIVGSPPCIGFSNANPKSGPDHWANKNFINCFRTISKLAPDYFLVEMVEPVFTKGLSTLEEAMSAVLEYFVYHKVFEISEYGFPSKRKRVYFFGSTRFFKENPLEKLPKDQNSITVTDLLEPFKEEFDKKEPDNYILLSRYRKDGKLRAGPFSILLKSDRKLKVDKPTPTITGAACSGIIHYGKDRFLALPEVAALMGFPGDYRFRVGSKRKSISQVAQIIASGVDIRFTTFLLEYLRNFIKNGQPSKDE